jgi:hypothetical protein
MILRQIAIPLVSFAVAGVVFAACPPTPPPIAAPGPDAADAFTPPPVVPDAAMTVPDATVADCALACAAMKRVGCKVLVDCAQVVCAANADPRFKHYNLLCLTHALVPSDVWACGADCALP